MTHRKKLQVAVASLFIAALCLTPVASASGVGSGSHASAGIFSMDGPSWLEAAWTLFTGWGLTGQDAEAPARGLDSVVEKGELDGFPPIEPEGGGMNNPNGGGGGDAGPGIDPDGKE